MLEGVLEKVLLQFLDPYVEGIQRDKLHLGVWSGTLQLEDLRVRKDFFQLLGIQELEVVTGSIGMIQLQVPWSSLTSGKVSLIIERVDVRLKSKHTREKPLETLVQELREGKLKAVEARENQLVENQLFVEETASRLGATEDPATAGTGLFCVGTVQSPTSHFEKDVSFAAKLTRRVIKNIHIEIRIPSEKSQVAPPTKNHR